MNNTPYVSVILPVYNCEEFISASIESILNQTYKNFEFIILNDGSTDNSSEIIREFNDPRILYLDYSKNEGLVYRINELSRLAKGKYIANMDHDDISIPTRLEKQVNFMEENPEYGMCYSRTIFIDKDSKELYRNNSRYFRSGNLFNELISAKYHPPSPTYFFRKSVLLKVGYYNTKIKHLDDKYITLKISKDYPIGFIDDFLVLQRRHDKNFTYSVNYDEQIKDANTIMEDYKYLENYHDLVKNDNLVMFSFFVDADLNIAKRYFIKSLPLFYKKRFIKSFLKYLKNLIRK